MIPFQHVVKPCVTSILTIVSYPSMYHVSNMSPYCDNLVFETVTTLSATTLLLLLSYVIHIYVPVLYYSLITNTKCMYITLYIATTCHYYCYLIVTVYGVCFDLLLYQMCPCYLRKCVHHKLFVRICSRIHNNYFLMLITH